MTHKEVVAQVAQECGLTKNETHGIIRVFLEVVKKEVKEGSVVKLNDFGSFKKVTRAARKGINPATKQQIDIAAKDVCKFKESTNFLD